MPAVFLHSCDSSNETLIWLTHPSWCHGGDRRNYTPPEPELDKNPPTACTRSHAEEEETRTHTHTKEVTIKSPQKRRNAHDTHVRRDDVTLHTPFPLVLNALQAKWKWLRTRRSLSGFVKLEHGATWAEQHSTKQYLPLHNDYSKVPGKSHWILLADLHKPGSTGGTVSSRWLKIVSINSWIS